MRRTPVMLMAALALVPVTIWTMSGSASAASGTLTVTTLDRAGTQVRTPLSVFNVATNTYYPATSGKARSLPKGTYAVLAAISNARGSAQTLGAKVLKVSGKTRTTIDARGGRAVRAALLPSPGAKYSQEISARVCAKDSVSYSVDAWGNAGQVFVIPNKSKHLRYGYSAAWTPTEWSGGQPPTYVVAGGAAKSIPATPSHTFRRSALAPVTVSVSRGPSIGSDVNTRLLSIAGNGCQDGLGRMIRQEPAPYRATVYASAGAWSLEAESYALEKDQFATVGHWRQTLKLTAGKAASRTFLRSAWGPADYVPFVVDRHVSFDTNGMFTAPGAAGNEAAQKSTVTLSLGGRVLKTKSRTNWGSYDTAFFEHKLPKKGWYTLNVAATRYRPGVRFPADLLSNKTNLRMSFYANPKSDKQAPLLLPRLTPLALDLNNKARKGSTTTVDILLQQRRQNPEAKYTKATARTVTAQASFDGGRTWRSVRVKKVGAKYQAAVPNRAAGYVALRTKVVTTGGYGTEVTIYRAYRVG